MQIGVIGGGIAGLTAAFRLGSHHEVTLYEANSYLGGHTNTVTVPSPNGELSIDTGFIVFNRRTYPLFCELLGELNVSSLPTEMSFSVSSALTGIEYCGSHLNGLFAQRSNLLRPRFYRLLRDFFRFARESTEFLAGFDESGDDEGPTVEDFLRQRNFSSEFANDYFLPMGSAIWSCPRSTFGQFPIRFIMEFYHHHGLLHVRGRPQWMVIQGGSRTYVDALTRRARATFRTGTPVVGLERSVDKVVLHLPGDRTASFDHVVMACHSDQALRILGPAATSVEREILGAFPYEPNMAILHTDATVLPRRRRAWASWNYYIGPDNLDRATVTYNMNILQRLNLPEVYCVTLNGEELIDPRKILGRFAYEHPVFTRHRRAMQRRHSELINHDRISYCGAYWGNGFHEDGVQSATRIVHELQPVTIEVQQ